MTDLHTLIATVRDYAANENVIRYGGRDQLKVKAPFVDVFLFENCPKIRWHSAIPNDMCAFTESFDDNHCAAYVYLCEEETRFRCTLELSITDEGHREDLPYISKSLDDHEIAQRVIASVVAGTKRMKPSGAV